MEWISVKDRFPESELGLQHEIICFDGEYIYQCIKEEGEIFSYFSTFYGVIVENVTHWMIIEKPFL